MSDDLKVTTSRQARDVKKTAHLREMYDRYAGRFRAVASQDAPTAARKAHIEIDALLDRDRKLSANSGDIRCGKGCNHCCRGPVEIWPQEAALLAETVRVAGMELDKARLERQSRHDMDAWREQPAADRACVFLGDDGACKVYESRPNACRKLLVMSDPALCDADKHPLNSVSRWFSWEAEMMESAALEICGAELMPRALLAALNQRGDE